MFDFVREAGWGIWPVFLVGAHATALAARYATRPRPELVPRIRMASLATLVLGVLGTVVGLKTSVAYVHQVEADERWVFLVGLSESLNNLVAALLIVFLVCALSYAGIHRAQRPRGAAAAPVPRAR